MSATRKGTFALRDEKDYKNQGILEAVSHINTTWRKTYEKGFNESTVDINSLTTFLNQDGNKGIYKHYLDEYTKKNPDKLIQYRSDAHKYAAINTYYHYQHDGFGGSRKQKKQRKSKKGGRKSKKSRSTKRRR